MIVCPTDVDPEDPRSYYSVSSRLAAETPHAWKANQKVQDFKAGKTYILTGSDVLGAI